MKLLLCLIAAGAVAGCVAAGPGSDAPQQAEGAPAGDSFERLQTAYQAQLYGGDEANAAAHAAHSRAVTARTVGGVETWQGGGLTGRVETLIVQDQCLFVKQEVDALPGEQDWGEPTWGWACRDPGGTWFQCGIGPGFSDPGSGPECSDP